MTRFVLPRVVVVGSPDEVAEREEVLVVLEEALLFDRVEVVFFGALPLFDEVVFFVVVAMFPVNFR
jgi:hypothetical protein